MQRRLLAAAAFLVLTLAAARYTVGYVARLAAPSPPKPASAARSYEGRRNPLTPAPDVVDAGRALYMRYCAFCHGAAGRGDGPAAKALVPPPIDFHGLEARGMSDGKLFGYITEGVRGTAMPGWGRVLSEEQRWQIVTFIRQAFQKS